MSSYVPIAIDIGTLGLQGSDGDDNRSAHNKSKNDFAQIFASLGFDSGTNEVAIGDTGASAAASKSRLRLKADFSADQSHLVMQDGASAAFHSGVDEVSNEYYIHVGNTLAVGSRRYTMNLNGEFGFNRAPVIGFTAAFFQEIITLRENGKASVQTRTYNDTPSTGSEIVLQRARGDEATPTPVESGDLIGGLSARGYDGAGFDDVGRFMEALATETWDATSHGTKVVIGTIANGAQVVTDRIIVDENGEIFMNLPTSAGTTGSLWNDAGTVKVA